jgi:Fur family ferric uptake transcriptional regulator
VARRRRTEDDDLGALLRGSGLRRTAPRIAVLRHLEAATVPASHGEIAEALAPKGLERVTVYRNLTDLVEAGLVTRRDLGDHVWRFELARGENLHASTHAHFLCIDCGAVLCLPEKAVNVRVARGVPRAVRSQRVEVQLRGLCDGCAAGR